MCEGKFIPGLYISESVIINHFYLLQLVPRWVAPNLLTFSGFMLLVLQTVVLTFYDPYWLATAVEYPEYPSIPPWVWWLCFCTQFFSHTLGKCCLSCHDTFH